MADFQNDRHIYSYGGAALEKITDMGKKRLLWLTLTGFLMLAGCQTNLSGRNAADQAQGSYENIASLTRVIGNNPNDPTGYNVRGSAYGRAGRYREAVRDFSTAIQLDPGFYAAYAQQGADPPLYE